MFRMIVNFNSFCNFAVFVCVGVPRANFSLDIGEDEVYRVCIRSCFYNCMLCLSTIVPLAVKLVMVLCDFTHVWRGSNESVLVLVHRLGESCRFPRLWNRQPVPISQLATAVLPPELLPSLSRHHHHRHRRRRRVIPTRIRLPATIARWTTITITTGCRCSSSSSRRQWKVSTPSRVIRTETTTSWGEQIGVPSSCTAADTERRTSMAFSPLLRTVGTR